MNIHTIKYVTDSVVRVLTYWLYICYIMNIHTVKYVTDSVVRVLTYGNRKYWGKYYVIKYSFLLTR